ncbi:hypothetical protein CH299_28045 [Rhodococcus sp. 14-2686-1-2]|nr:hypothetical protein CH301_27525 [Rhodococcus sp. 15-1189-1-1a]OZF08317.1 hypothetical protein CH299_28045 [Rhodococcus sp. 14-2686-1-2]
MVKTESPSRTRSSTPELQLQPFSTERLEQLLHALVLWPPRPRRLVALPVTEVAQILAARYKMRYTLSVSTPSITWTDDSEEHIARHAVRPEEVESVVFGRPRLRVAGQDGTTYYFGQTDAGRYLFVVTVPALDGGTYIVTARNMTLKEKTLFDKKSR